MADTIRLWTQQGHDIDLTGKSGPIDLSRSQYARHPGYAGRVAELARLVGCDQFVWCSDESSEFAFAQPEPRFEWLIEIERGRILGYVKDDPWSAYIHGGELGEVFSTSRPAGAGVSCLVRFPLSQADLITRWDLMTGKRPKLWRGEL